ncbi:hypothetical protein LEMLEM_LOCUS23772, partial [Lemmus lemmus]
ISRLKNGGTKISKKGRGCSVFLPECSLIHILKSQSSK